MSFAKFDIVYGHNHPMLLVLMGPMAIPYYQDGCASEFSKTPLDIQNPKEWESTFQGYVCYDLIEDKHIIISALHDYKKFDGHCTEGYIPFDHATGRNRLLLGLLKLADKWYGNKPKE